MVFNGNATDRKFYVHPTAVDAYKAEGSCWKYHYADYIVEYES